MHSFPNLKPVCSMSITEEGFLISPCFSLELCIQMGISFLFSLPLASLLFSAICKVSSENCFAFLHFFFFRMGLITSSCRMSWTSIHSSSGTLSDLIPWIYFSLSLYNHKGLDLAYISVVYWFPLLSSVSVWIWQERVHDLSHSQLPVLFLLTV